MKGEEGHAEAGGSEGTGGLGGARGGGSLTQGNGGGRGEGGGGTEGREGKVGAERFKLTQNSTVKDKSRGKIQLKGTSPTFHHGEELTAFHTRVERGLCRTPRAPRDYRGFSAALSPGSLGLVR